MVGSCLYKTQSPKYTFLAQRNRMLGTLFYCENGLAFDSLEPTRGV